MWRSLRIPAWWLIAPTAWACGGTPVGPGGNGNGNDDPVPARVALVTQPGQAQTGRPFFAQPVVQVQDSAGNALAAAGVPVQVVIASGPPGASLSGATTATSGADGRAAFTGLQLNGTAGVYTLAFESTELAAATSAPLALLPVNPLIPLTELAPFTYFDHTGGLYPNGSNAMPTRHDSVGRARARAVVPRLANGTPNPGGKYVIMSMGMSNTTMEWCATGGQSCDSWTFTGQAAADAAVNATTLAIVNGAMGGQTAATWDQPTDLNYDRVRDDVLAPQGLSEAQVQVIWLKVANPTPDTGPGSGPMPAAGSDADSLVMRMGAIIRAAKVRYPNLQMVFASSRIYAGYANITLNPEPYAFEYGFSVKWLVEAQIAQMSGGPPDPRAGNLNYDTVAPWIAWGPYLWANGLTPRADGLIWERTDLAADGTHPSTPGGRQKVGTMLLTFFKTSPHSACWFVAGQNCP